jgi:hypothetical protein
MAIYHVELRKFPRTVTRFNQTGQQVGALVLPWVQDRIVEVDGDKWAPYESTIAILEGPEIPIAGLSMGRGWATAKREGTDVTERVLAEARAALADGSAAGSRSSFTEPPVDTRSAPTRDLGLDELLGSESARLLSAWSAIVARTGGLKPSESLALAEIELQRDGEATQS